jgi:hypothetical protein
MAHFWDTHGVVDFEDELQEVTEPVFERDKVVRVHLTSKEAETVDKLAKSQGVDAAHLIRQWVLQRVQTSS